MSTLPRRVSFRVMTIKKILTIKRGDFNNAQAVKWDLDSS